MTTTTKRFKALSFVWLLFCFLATHLYANSAELEGLFMRVFMYGVFASPVWLNFGWSYLYEESPIKFWFYIPVALGYVFWACGESIAGGYNPEPRVILAFVSGAGFLILAYPSLQCPSWLRQLGIALNPFHDTKTASLLASPSNHAIYFAARIIACILLWLLAMVLIHGYTAHDDMLRYKANTWSVNILPFIAVAVFSSRIGFIRKVVCFAGTLFALVAAMWLIESVKSLLMDLFHVKDIERIFQVVKVQSTINMVLLVASYGLLYAWIRKQRRTLESSAKG